MKITIKLLAVTAILFVLLTPAGSASAEVFKYTNADAYFNSTDGCILTDVMIFVWEEGIYSVSILQHDSARIYA